MYYSINLHKSLPYLTEIKYTINDIHRSDSIRYELFRWCNTNVGPSVNACGVNVGKWHLDGVYSYIPIFKFRFKHQKDLIAFNLTWQ